MGCSQTEPGRIAFFSGGEDNWQLYVMNADGSNPTPISDVLGEEESPLSGLVWSPDGSKIAFTVVKGDGESFSSCVVNADGSGQGHIPNIGLPGRMWGMQAIPTILWSPDGSKVTIMSTDADEHFFYVLMEAYGSNPIRLDDPPGASSPDGLKVAFVSEKDGNPEIYMRDSDGSNLTQLTNDAPDDFNPVWSPAGESILFFSYREGGRNSAIYIMDADGSNPVRLTDESNYHGDYDLALWSADGSRIFFTADPHDPNYEKSIYVVEIDGSNLTRLTDDLGDDYLHSLSRDGSKIMFLSTTGA